MNGESQPGQPLTLDFENNIFLNRYRSIFSAVGKLYRDEGIDIQRNDYKNGYTIFGFDLSSSLCNGGHQELSKRGSLRLELEFQKALENTINIIVYSEFDNLINIDKYRNVIKDY